IFGVDRNPTAVWLGELRLWLSVVIESDVTDPWRVPPLPNLDHHVRVGDALAVPAGLGGATDARWGGAPWGLGVPRAGAGIATQRARYARCTGARKRAAARRLDDAERTRALATLDRALVAMRHTRRELLAAARARDLFGTRREPSARDRERLATLRASIRVSARHRRAIADGAALPFGFGWHFGDAAAASGFDLVVGNPPWVRPHALPVAERSTLRATYAAVRDAAWRTGTTLAGAGTGFGGQVDLAAPFVERSLALLRPGGTLALLVPAKLWRSLAGGGLRALLAREADVRALEDWTEAPAIFDAATYPSLLLATRRVPRDDARAPTPPPIQVRAHRRGGIAEATLAPDSLPLDRDDAASPWLLLPHDVRAALDRLRAAGTALGASGLARPTLGVKCGCNDAFLLEVESGDGELATVRARGRIGQVERALLRPVLRGEDLAHTSDRTLATALLWTHGDDGAPLAALPPRAARWLAPWRTRLLARTDARASRAWWALYRTPAADASRARVAWADLARAPSPRLLRAGDPTVPLNSCYVAAFDDERDARAFATLLAAPPLVAWLGALAEPARGGFRRHLAWTVALLPVPRDWHTARDALADAWDAPPATRTLVVCSAYDIPAHALAPLLAWDAGLVPYQPARMVREERTRAHPATLAAPIAPTRWRGPPGHGTSCPR
ncbi:MAG: Eco57I restriction-modification methylase domain-containing protein, partial [Gemmatirosa sp.]